MKWKKTAMVVSIGALGLGALTLSAMPALASSNGIQACTLVADQPRISSSYNVTAVGGRSGCTDTVSRVNVAIIRDIQVFADPMQAESSRNNVGNLTWVVSFAGDDGNAYYTRTESSTGAKAESGSVSRP